MQQVDSFRSLLPYASERLCLREWTIEDASWMFRLNEDPAVLRYTGDRPFASVKHAEVFLQSYSNYKRDGFGRWAVELNHSRESIGWCGLRHNDWGVDLGFRFFRNYWGKGYATEAARASLELAQRMGIPKVWGRALLQNPASIAVLEKAGMTWMQDVPFATFAKEHGMDPEELGPWSKERIALYCISL